MPNTEELIDPHDRSLRFMRSAFPWAVAPDETAFLSAARQIQITVKVGAADASSRSVQFLVLTLANLLLRLPFQLRMRLLDSQLMAQVPPYEGGSVREALERLASSLAASIDFGVPTDSAAGISLSIETPAGEMDMSLGADGWVGRLAVESQTAIADDPNPLGPFAAACAGASETVRAWARTAAHLGIGEPRQRFHADAASTTDAAVNLWRPGTTQRGPRVDVERLAIPAIDWCGAGAVGQNAFAVLGGIPPLRMQGRVSTRSISTSQT